MRRMLFVFVLVLAGCADPNRHELSYAEKARLGIDPDRDRPIPSTKLSAADKRRLEGPHHEEKPMRSMLPPPTIATPVSPAAPEELQPVDCAGTRATRVKTAQENIAFWNKHIKEITPLVKWAAAHKCQLKDTSGSMLVQRTHEAGGVRVTVTRGHPDELICDTTNIPDGVDDELLREIALLENTDEDEVMFSTVPECDDKEKPSLRVRYKDHALQKTILALP